MSLHGNRDILRYPKFLNVACDQRSTTQNYKKSAWQVFSMAERGRCVHSLSLDKQVWAKCIPPFIIGGIVPSLEERHICWRAEMGAFMHFCDAVLLPPTPSPLLSPLFLSYPLLSHRRWQSWNRGSLWLRTSWRSVLTTSRKSYYSNSLGSEHFMLPREGTWSACSLLFSRFPPVTLSTDTHADQQLWPYGIFIWKSTPDKPEGYRVALCGVFG